MNRLVRLVRMVARLALRNPLNLVPVLWMLVRRRRDSGSWYLYGVEPSGNEAPGAAAGSAVGRWLGLRQQLPRPEHLAGHAWFVRMPELAFLADTQARPPGSLVVIWEDGSPLPHPHSSHREIQQHGGGRFTHWDEHLVFSSSDGSDPGENGRSYRYSTAWWYYVEAYGGLPSSTSEAGPRFEPRNWQVSCARPELLDGEARDSIDGALAMLRRLPEGRGAIRGRSVLEIGPGHHYGAGLVMACLGARVGVCDRFPVPWNRRYHPLLYRRLLELLGERLPEADLEPIRQVIATGDHAAVVALHSTPAEDLDGVAGSSLDLVYSCAVLEHVVDLRRVAAELARVTVRGGLGLHLVDHRDHRDFQRPLEFLVMPDDRFEELFAATHAACGNRLRRSEVVAAFEGAGFEVVAQEVSERAGPGYLEQLEPRLRSATSSRHHAASQDDLETLSCSYLVRRR